MTSALGWVQALPPLNLEALSELHPLVFNKGTLGKLSKSLKDWDWIDISDWISCWAHFERSEGIGE